MRGMCARSDDQAERLYHVRYRIRVQLATFGENLMCWIASVGRGAVMDRAHDLNHIGFADLAQFQS
jgi:hypothetical protein